MADENRNMALSPGHLLSEERVLRIPPSSTTENNKGNCDKIKLYNKTIRIGTWNVRSLFMAGKLANVEAEMCRMDIKILGLSEVRWPGSGKQKTKTGYIYYSGGTDTEHRYGTAILLSDEIAQSVIDHIPFNDRVMLLKLQTTHRILNIIQIYAPTGDKTDAEIEEFYNSIDEVMKLTKTGEITAVIGDFNAKIGEGSEGNSVGAHGLGNRNSLGDRLVQFCAENNFCVTNTFFKLHPRRLYTWRSPADTKERLIRNQIDFILVGLKFKKYVKSVKTYPGADINSDHNPVVMDFTLRRFTAARRQKPTKRIDIRKLKDPVLKTLVSNKYEQEMEKVERTEPIEVETTWNTIKNSIKRIQEHDIGPPENSMKQEWMTSEILELMNERRTHKRDNVKYKELNKAIRKKCRDAKEQWMSDKCTEIELLQKKHDTFNLHRKVKEMTDKHRKHQQTVLRDKNDDIIVGIEEKLRRWEEYVEERLVTTVRSGHRQRTSKLMK